ncbi:MAG: 30S ribosomal protein S17 [Candidatus Micrarchaeota archaeon]|nr:30S ribosomal protein S17 [Candidatus Micrarchaeota archaeon]
MAKKRKGIYPTRGLIFSGIVVSDRAKKTVIVQRDLVSYIPKYQRYARKISKIAAHNPENINAQVGDIVQIAECRKISKTKAWIVTKILKKGQGHLQPGQVKERDEAQAMHMRKHGGFAPKEEKDSKAQKQKLQEQNIEEKEQKKQQK